MVEKWQDKLVIGKCERRKILAKAWENVYSGGVTIYFLLCN